jgi:SPP1 family predicted phage head-tail adaptor
MNAGELIHRIEVQAIGTTRGAAGEVVDTWSTETNGTVWASIKPGSGREFFNAKQINAELTHIIKMRYHAGLSPAKRILYGTRVFNIQEVRNTDEHNTEMIVYAKEMV